MKTAALLALAFWAITFAASLSAEPSIQPPAQVPLLYPPAPLRADAPSWESDGMRAASPSTTDLSLQRLYTLIDERDRQYRQRFEDFEKAMNAQFVAARESVNAALAAAAQAVNKAEASSNERLNQMNEFRGQQKDLIGLLQVTLMPRAEADSRFDTIEKKLTEMNAVIIRAQGQFSTLSWLWGAMGALFGGLIGIFTLVMGWRKQTISVSK